MKTSIRLCSIATLIACSLLTLPSCAKKGSIKYYGPQNNMTAFGIGGMPSGEASPNKAKRFELARPNKYKMTDNTGLYMQTNGVDIARFDIGIENPEKYRLLSLIETDEFLEISIGTIDGFKEFYSTEWYATSPRMGSGIINNSERDMHFYIIEKKTKKVGELIGSESEYFPASGSVSLNGNLYSIINNPKKYGEGMIVKYHFDDKGLVREAKALEREVNPDRTQLFKDDQGSLYYQYVGDNTVIVRFNEKMEEEDHVDINRQLNGGASLAYLPYYLSPTNHLYGRDDETVFNGHLTVGGNIIDEKQEQYDVSEFVYFNPGCKFTVSGMSGHDYGPCSIETICKIYEDDEAKYYNYGKLSNNLIDLLDSFQYAKYFKDPKKQPIIKSFELDQLGAVIGREVYYIKDNNVHKFDVYTESDVELCNVEKLNLLEITSLYLGDESKIYIEGLDKQLSEVKGVIKDGEVEFVTTPSTTYVTTLLPLN